MSALQNVTTADFQATVLNAEAPVLVDFWAEWCGPCRMLGPIVEKLGAEYAGRLTVLKLNTDENPEVAGKYGISGIPCLILFKGGKDVDRFVGFDKGPGIKAMLSKHLPAT